MSKKVKIGLSIAFTLMSILAILLFFFGDSGKESYMEEESTISEFNGVDGNNCRIIVDGVTYQIDQDATPYWSNGVHTASRGIVRCGSDVTNKLLLSPHGKSVLSDNSVTIITEE